MANENVTIPLDPMFAGIAMARATEQEQAIFVDAFVRELHEGARSKEGVQHQIECAKDALDPWTKMLLGLTEALA